MTKENIEKTAAEIADKATETVTEAAHQGMDVARKIWLAGVGAYGKMFEQAQDQFEKVSDAAQEVFEQLVEQGEKVEELVKTKLAQSPTAMNATAKASKFMHDATDQVKEYRETRLSNIENRLEHLRDTIVEKVQPFNIFALGQKIEELTATVAKLKTDVKALKGTAPAKEAAAPKAKKAA
ncbi:MAG: phasin family protein [Pseudomonadota bacterium]